jgi:hypothetical protein
MFKKRSGCSRKHPHVKKDPDVPENIPHVKKKSGCSKKIEVQKLPEFKPYKDREVPQDPDVF